MRDKLRIIISIVGLLVTIILCYCNSLKAEERIADYCKSRGLGWHFYCDPEKEEKQEEKEPALQTLKTEKEQMAEIRQKLDDLKVKAVINPTEDNVKNYIKFQQEQTDRAAKFSRVWRRVQWKNPELDYRTRHPSTTEGLSVEYKEISQKKKQALKDLGKRYGLFFFYKGEDLKSQNFGAKVVRGFVDYNKLDIRAISIDGVVLKEFPDSLIDKGEVEKLGVKKDMTPSIALFDIKEKKLIPISSGMIGVEDLENRIYLLTKVSEVDDEDL